MKKLILIASLVLMAGCERVYEGELQERQDLRYAPNETEGFTGVNRVYYENGELKG